MIVVMVIFILSGVVLAVVSVPLMMGKIPPNGLYGFRVRKTMERPEIWYPVNKYGGERLLMVSLMLIVAAVGFTYFPGIAIDIYSYAVLITWMVGASIAIVSSFRYMNTLTIGKNPINSSLQE